jgi:6-phosphofructokinase 1
MAQLDLSRPRGYAAGMITQPDLVVSTLGDRRFLSPLPMSTVPGDGVGDFVPDDTRVLFDICHRAGHPPSDLAFERAGARQRLFFDPSRTRAAIVTCGGLSPGINNVIRTLYFELVRNYGVQEVLGIRFGYQGLNPREGKPPVTLTAKMVDEIHLMGGTLLGTSRGPQKAETTVEFLTGRRIDILFCVGGDGTQRGAHEIAAEAARRRLPIAIVGVPKTIDNDIAFCQPTFGFATAVAEADTVLDRAHTEAIGVLNGVGLVRLMGREAGYITAAATIANGHVNFALIPEVRFELDGSSGLLAKLERRLAEREHAVIAVAEGAGQDLLPDHKPGYDASGNRTLGDIGVFLKKRIEEHFAQRNLPISVRYFDPSYHIRSCQANTTDSLLCEQFARNAAHAAMAGKTDMFVGRVHGQYIHVPLAATTGQRKRLSPEDDMWAIVLAITGQNQW